MVVQRYTDWAELDDVTYANTDMPSTERDVEGPSVMLPQWISDGSGGLMPGPNLFTLPGSSLSFPQMLLAPFEVADARGDIEVRQSRNFALLSGYQFPMNYVDKVGVTVQGIRFTDPDADWWREQMAVTLINEWWETEAPSGAYSPRVEWEGFEPESGQRFGEVHDRTVSLSYAELLGWDSTATKVAVVDDESGVGFSNPDRADFLITPPEPDVSLWGSPAFLAGDEYAGERSLWQPGGIGFDDTTLKTIFDEGAYIGTAPGSSDTFDIDAHFADISARVTRVGRPGTVSDSATLWVFPQLLGDTRHLIFDGELDLTIGLSAILTPPRYRITYSLDRLPHRRTHPIDGGVPGKSRRTWPTSRATQASNRTSGGHL